MSALAVTLDGAGRGADHMHRDEALLAACARGDMDGAVRIYWFEPPCLSLGRLQPESDVDTAACARDGIAVVRRPSGGRAVLHEEDVTYAVICRVTDPVFGGAVLQACERIHAAVAAGLASLDVATAAQCTPRDLRTATREIAALADCFARPAAHELVDSTGRKLVGSAQARRGGALLQHGSVLLETPRATAYLTNAPASSPPGGLRLAAGRRLTREEVAGALHEAFLEALSRR